MENKNILINDSELKNIFSFTYNIDNLQNLLLKIINNQNEFNEKLLNIEQKINNNNFNKIISEENNFISSNNNNIDLNNIKNIFEQIQIFIQKFQKFQKQSNK